MDEQDETLDQDESAIAIIGMACHLPGCLNTEEYWSNLRDGVESVKFYTDEELLAAGESAANLKDPHYVRAQPDLENYDRFDAAFWGFSPQDAAVTDPAHRLFLEVAYESLEHAGRTGYDEEGRVGVFAGSGASLYWMQNLQSNPQLIEDMGEFLVRHTGNDMNFLATRLSYELDLRGPSINVQTACSSALVSVHMAVQSLLSGESDMAIAGGSTVLLPQKRGYIFRDGEILSPDGHCRPFDAKSAGTVFGSGAGSVVLKRMDDAIADGDTIHAIIRGTAINNDGAQKIGFLAPSVDGQAGAIAEALSISGIDAGDVSYIETHGTGTQVGDPIEFEAINQVFKDATDKRDYCRIGSVKSNIGHLGEAAGAAAIIKVILALQNRQIPASLNYESPNPQLALDDSPFIINSKLTPWESDGPRIAGITALGAGGTNAYVLVEEAEEEDETEPTAHHRQLLVLSAKSSAALNNASRNLAAFLRQNPDHDLADVAHTLQVGRRAYSYRRALACSNHDEAITRLESSDSKQFVDAQCTDHEPSLVFMFPGGGAQYAGMGKDLYDKEPVYREAFDACMNCLDSSFAEKVKSLIFASEAELENATEELQRPSLTLTALFAVEYSLATQLMAWGAKPAALIGHSMGENTAACIAGVLQLKDAMKLVLIRGQLFEKTPEGGMLSISLSQQDARQYMTEEMDFAAANAPGLCVASGAAADIDALQATLEAKEIDCHRVRIQVAAHSRLLETILDDFRSYLQSISLSQPTIPFTSNLTGDWITDEQATDPNYWVDHLRNTVRFADNIETVVANEERVIVEIGPGRTLTNLAKAGNNKANAIFNSIRHPNESDSDVDFALRTLGNIWANGIKLDWSQYRGDELRRRVPLPTYPFERKAYWVDPGVGAIQNANQAEVLKKRPDSEDWFARMNWHQSGLSPLKETTDNRWLIFTDEVGLSTSLIAELISKQSQTSKPVITTVGLGKQFKDSNPKDKNNENRSFELDPNNNSHFDKLLAAVFETEFPPQHIIYMWPTSASVNQSNSAIVDKFDSQVGPCFWGLFNLSKILGELDDPMTLSVISSDMHSLGGLASDPAKHMLVGPVAVLPHETMHVNTRSIDVHIPNTEPFTLDKIAKQITRELRSEPTDQFVAYRGLDRWTRKIEPTSTDPISSNSSWLPPNSSILITGGLGGIGLNIAKQLASRGAKNIVLVSRSGPTQEKASKIKEIESMGTRVITVAADVTDHAAMKKAIDSVSKDLAKNSDLDKDKDAINGVIHAAGSMDDQLIVLKSRESAETVINAKVRGAINLDSIFANTSLDFFVVFSSVASYLGLPGQIDYSSANAFLDAFARERSLRAPGRTLAINWNAWAEVGMAASLLNENKGEHSNTAPKQTVQHPLLDNYVELNGDEHLYTTQFNLQNHWILSEHRTVQGAALIPGTGYIELLRASFSHHIDQQKNESTQEMAMELSDVQFLSAFQVEENKDSELKVSTEGSADSMSISIYSDSDELPHATGSVRSINAPSPSAVNVAAIRDRCNNTASTKGKFMDQIFMDFGPRWGCINSISYAENEAVVDLELPQDYASDLDNYKLHPSVLDMATGSTQFLLEGLAKEDFYVPVAYEKVLITGDMPRTIVSHIRAKESDTPGFAQFDITLMDQDGLPFVEINGFTMRKVDIDFTSEQASSGSTQETATDNTEQTHAVDPLEEILREAILPDEGVRVFDQVMAQDQSSAQWIISSVDSDLWLRQLNAAQLDQSSSSDVTSFVKEDLHDPDIDPDIAEIEQLLASHDGVAVAVVRSHLDDNSRRRLIAHFIADEDEYVTVTELRKFAKANLEASLVPLQLIELDEWPEDSDGNIDRTQLLDPFAPVDHHIPPVTRTEKKLAQIWQSAVGVPRISLTDNFFDIGGHSLVSIRVIVKVKKELGVRLDQAKMVLLTLEQMANEIDMQLGVSNTDDSADDNSGDEASTESSNETITGETEQSMEDKKEKSPGKLFKSFFKRK
ncbi:MAG: SDR family NAD(P)-dependent oxidoreductase [Pseudomonadales bacterium]|nr:SDR family NAD(P)-dependent oxidoreductase [Pseudomonadales bacterium]